MGQKNTCMCASSRALSPATKSTTDRNSLTNYSYGQNMILKDQVRIMIVGTKQSGKTTLLNNLILKDQKQMCNALRQIPHGGIQFKNVKLNLDELNIQNNAICRFIDVEGDFFEQLEHIKKHIPSCDGFIIMCDMSNSASIQEAEEILKYLEKGSSKKQILFLANKSDLEESNQNYHQVQQITSTINNFQVNTCSLIDGFQYNKYIQQIVYASSLINIK